MKEANEAEQAAAELAERDRAEKENEIKQVEKKRRNALTKRQKEAQEIIAHY